MDIATIRQEFVKAFPKLFVVDEQTEERDGETVVIKVTLSGIRHKVQGWWLQKLKELEAAHEAEVKAAYNDGWDAGMLAVSTDDWKLDRAEEIKAAKIEELQRLIPLASKYGYHRKAIADRIVELQADNPASQLAESSERDLGVLHFLHAHKAERDQVGHPELSIPFTSDLQ